MTSGNARAHLGAAPTGPLEGSSPGRLARFGAIALLIESAILVAVGTSQHWLVHPKKDTLDSSRFVEAEMVQIPKEKPALTEEKPVTPPHHERVFSKVPQQGRKAKPEEKNPVEESNVTHSHTQLGPTHGPVAVYSPAPTIPPYLQNQNLHANVVIDFYVTAQGGAIPKLVGSSGNEELDAIAINTAKKWQFRPAEKDHQPIDSKVRLRIVFEVH